MNLHELLSTKLSPSDLKEKKFKGSLLGFSKREVRNYLDGVSKVWDRIQKREKDLSERLKSMGEDLARLRAQETELEKIKLQAKEEAKSVLERAQKEAEAYLSEVHKKAEELRVKTEEWLEKTILDIEEAEQRREILNSSLKSLLDQHYSLLAPAKKENQLHELSGNA